MKVLQVIDRLDVGGAEKVFVDIVNLLNSKKNNVDCLFLLEKGRCSSELVDNISYYELNRSYKFSVYSMWQCKNIIKNYDIVHCHMRHVFRYVRLVQFVFRINTIVILHDHYGSINIDESVPAFFKSIFKPKYYIGVSNSLTAWAKTHLNMNSENIFCLHNIVVPKRTIKGEVRISDFVIVGNIKPIKNQKFAIQLASKANASLNIIGAVQDEVYMHELNDLVLTNGLDVEFYHHITDAQSNVVASRIGLCTSFSESGPIVLIEYLSKGIPFISYKTGEIADLLYEYLPEFFVDSFDLKLWMERLETILCNGIDQYKLIEIYNHLFSTDKYVSELECIYKKICVC